VLALPDAAPVQAAVPVLRGVAQVLRVAVEASDVAQVPHVPAGAQDAALELRAGVPLHGSRAAAQAGFVSAVWVYSASEAPAG
jgi:hypothetical protein